MNMSSTTAPAKTAATRGWYTPDDCRLSDFRAVVEQTTDLADYPSADDVRSNVLVYGRKLAERTATTAGRREVQAELARALLDGPGIVVFAGAFDPAVVDRASEVFWAIIDEQKASRRGNPVTTSPRPATTTGSGARWTSSRCGRPRCSPTTTPTT